MSPTTLDDAMAALSAGVLENAEHPSAHELLDYQAGKLDAAARTQLREHLAWCSECARTVVDLTEWPEVELDDSSLERTDDEEAEDWQAIRRRLSHDDVSEPVPFHPRPTRDLPPPVPRRAYGPVHLVAAVLALAVVGLSVQLVRLSRAPVTTETPQANVFVVDLEPAGDVATRGLPAGKTEVPAGMETVVFLLVQDDLRPFDDHAVELRGADGEVFWQAAGLVSPPEGGFSVAVPLNALPTDDVEIRLFGIDGGDRELLAVYRTRIERTAADGRAVD